eukprot:SAG31_NODE_714_length_12645_cov_15.347760_6_plen_84_part_00
MVQKHDASSLLEATKPPDIFMFLRVLGCACVSQVADEGSQKEKPANKTVWTAVGLARLARPERLSSCPSEECNLSIVFIFLKE